MGGPARGTGQRQRLGENAASQRQSIRSASRGPENTNPRQRNGGNGRSLITQTAARTQGAVQASTIGDVAAQATQNRRQAAAGLASPRRKTLLGQ
jgi:hypothetical protein